MLTLHSYFRSSASYRVRIALNLKGLPYTYLPVHLLKDGGQQHTEAYQRINPARLVPALVEDGHAIVQSMAIMEYLDETHPEPALLPRDPLARARVRGLAQSIACEIQVRTLFEEVWGEIDHVLNYPEPTNSIACTEQLRVLAKMVGAGTRLAEAIFRSHGEFVQKNHSL